MNKHQQLEKFDNSWYNPGASWFKRVLWYLTNNLLVNSWVPLSSLKVFVLRLFGAKVGRGCVIKNNVNIKYPWLLSIGDNCWIGEGVWIDNLALVTVGNNVCISQGALLLTGNHNYKKESFDLMVGKIVLEDGVWIGARSVVCPGVTCKSHTVVSVGSIVSKDTEPFGIYAGNPARKIRDRVIE